MKLPSHAALVAAAALLLASSCEQAGAASTPSLSSSAAPAASSGTRLVAPEPVRYAPQVVATGMIKPRQTAQLAFSVGGTLSRIAVKRGDEVKEGALLMALDDAAAGATVRQTEAAIAAAKAQLDLAEDGLRRITAIREKDGATEMQVVQVRAQRDLAAAQLAAAQAQAELARINLAHQYLRAPFAGIVLKVPEGLGTVVGPGVPVLGLSSTRQLYLETSLTQEDVAGLKPGAKVSVRVPASGVSTDEATVAVVLGVVDPMTTRIPVEIAVPNADGRFLAGAFARAQLPRGAERDAFKIPSSALVQREAGFAVFSSGPESRARLLPVRLLGEEGESSVVLPEDGTWTRGATRVVLSPAAGLSEGALLAAPETGR
ncbi:MAG TPA: efflux RND transporter periplasmic adaptor subunit [Myxococcales bacterium]|jgi:RND family efflux transporter MFP subunit